MVTPRADEEAAWLARIDEALARGRAAQALQYVQEMPRVARTQPAGAFRAAQAYFQLGVLLGEADVRTVPEGRPGQFAGDLLLVEPRPGPDRFLCCPKASALYQLRLALDGGLDEPAAHVLHARIWQRLGRSDVALGILRARSAVLLADPDLDTLDTYSQVALDTDALSDYLRCARLRAARCPERRRAILVDACLTVADRYSQRGDETLHLEWLRRAVRHMPDDGGLWLRLADAEWAAGWTDDAVRHYRHVLHLSPEHAERGRILHRLAASRLDAEP